MKSLGDAIDLRNTLIARLEEANPDCATKNREPLLTFVVAGGGFAGAETVGSIKDFLHDALPYYPNLKPEMIKTVLVHPGDFVLPELGEGLGRYAWTRQGKRPYGSGRIFRPVGAWRLCHGSRFDWGFLPSDRATCRARGQGSGLEYYRGHAPRAAARFPVQNPLFARLNWSTHRSGANPRCQLFRLPCHCAPGPQSLQPLASRRWNFFGTPSMSAVEPIEKESPSARTVAIVTGASRGIGAGVARQLLSDGWRIAVAARSESGLKDICMEAGASNAVAVMSVPEISANVS